MFTISSVKHIGNKHDVYRTYIMEIIKFKKQEMKLLTNEKQKSYPNAKLCHICEEKFQGNFKVTLGTIVIMQGNIEVLNIAYII